MEISLIKPYPKNAKKHDKKQIKQVADSIKRFGFVQPIVIDKNNEVVIGHCRLEAAKLLGLTEVPTISVENLSDKEVKALRLADNKLNESAWEMNLVIDELKGLDTELLDLTGFDRDLIIEGNEQDDVIPENAPTVAKLGDIWALGRHRVMCGDSTKKEDVERLMDGKKADMVFTDPPYNVAYVGKTEEKLTIGNDKMSQENFKIFCNSFIKNILEFCNGCIYICMSSSEWGTIQNAFMDLGGHWSRVIIWVKDRMVMSRADYHTQFEPIAVVNEDANEEGEPILYGWKKGIRHFFKGGRKQTDIWRIERPLASREHPTMKPVQLCVRAIVNNTELDGLVMDLFLGSGSTLIASEKTKRRNKNQKTCSVECGTIIKIKRGADSPYWKGDKASYSAKHLWLIRNKGKATKCEECGSNKNVDWANKTGKYLRDMSDWLQLCRSCHMIFDEINTN